MSAARAGQVIDEYGRPVPGAAIYVYDLSGNSASIYSDSGHTLAITQPLIADEFGNYTYYAADNFYREDTWFAGRMRFRENGVAVGDTAVQFEANLATLAPGKVNIDSVAADLTNINLVAPSITNVNTVAGVIANVNTVAGSIASVNTCAGNIAAIIAAPTQATNAANSATAAAASAATIGLVTSPAGNVAGVRDASGNLTWYVDENGVTNAGAIKTASINGLTVGAIAKLLGAAPLTIGAATRYLSPVNGQSLAIGEGATADPFTNAGAVALSTDMSYTRAQMFSGGVRPDDSNGLANGTYNLSSLVPHVEAALTSASDPTGAGETPAGGFNAMLFQLLNSYGMAPIDVPFNLISAAVGQGATAISLFRSGGTLFTRFMSVVTAAHTLAAGQNVQMPWHLWLQGESGQKDDGYITQLTGLAAEVDSSTRAILTQQTDPVVTFTYQLDRPQACHWYIEAAKASALVRIVGPMYPYPVAGMRGTQFDTVHRQASAYRLYGATAAVAVFCHYFLKRPWRPLQLSYNARGNLHCRVDGSDLILTYDVPHGGALTFDTPGLDLTKAGPTILVAGGNRWAAQRGFYLFNSAGTEKPLTDVKIENRNQVRLVGASPVAGDKLRIGYKDNTLDQAEAVVVNLRDCQGDVITFDDGGKVPVHNWALGEERTLTSGDLS